MNLNQEEKWLLSEKYEGVESDDFLVDLERLLAGEPLAYVIGFVPFLGCRIHLDSHPLIPRPETEYWVERAIEEIKKTDVGRVLDLCAGSGCIGVAVAKHCPNTEVVFAEIDPLHLPTIEKNLATNLSKDGGGMADRFSVVQSDLFENVTGKFDLILSNPPYIDPAVDRAEVSVKEFEPHLALYGGQGGLDLIDRMINEAPGYLNPGGQLWIEHELEQVEAIKDMAGSHGFSMNTYQDQYGVERFSILVLS